MSAPDLLGQQSVLNHVLSYAPDKTLEVVLTAPSARVVDGLREFVDPDNLPDDWLDRFFSRVSSQGRLIDTKEKGFGRFCGGSRGKIRGLSKLARRTLLKSFGKVRLVGGRFYFLTLTFTPRSPLFREKCIVVPPQGPVELQDLTFGPYPREYYRTPEEFAIWRPFNSLDRFEIAKRVLHSFFTAIKKKGFSGLWVLEKTAAGIPHFHVILKARGAWDLGAYFDLDQELFDHRALRGQIVPNCDWGRPEGWDYVREKQVDEADRGIAGIRLSLQKTWACSATGIHSPDMAGDDFEVFRDVFRAGIDVRPLDDPANIAGYFSKYFTKGQEDNLKGYQKDGLVGRVWGVFNRAEFLEPEKIYYVPINFLHDVRRKIGESMLAIYDKESDGIFNKAFVVLNNDKAVEKWISNQAVMVCEKADAYIRKNGFNLVKKWLSLDSERRLHMRLGWLALAELGVTLDTLTAV